jgi:hypothetical protein
VGYPIPFLFNNFVMRVSPNKCLLTLTILRNCRVRNDENCLRYTSRLFPGQDAFRRDRTTSATWTLGHLAQAIAYSAETYLLNARNAIKYLRRYTQASLRQRGNVGLSTGNNLWILSFMDGSNVTGDEVLLIGSSRHLGS